MANATFRAGTDPRYSDPVTRIFGHFVRGRRSLPRTFFGALVSHRYSVGLISRRLRLGGDR